MFAHIIVKNIPYNFKDKEFLKIEIEEGGLT
jgi:hypothetical protein